MGNDGNREINKDPEKQESDVMTPWPLYSRWLTRIFLVSCVLGVLFDPLFLYVPITNEEKKCLARDERMKYVALVLRYVAHFCSLTHLFFHPLTARGTAKQLKSSVLSEIRWLYLLFDILVIIPLPEVTVFVFFSKIAGSRSMTGRKVLNTLLLLQYMPRILGLFLSAKDLGQSFDSLTRRASIRAAFCFFLYITSAHVLGAFWYFYSIYRETACWHRACKHYPGCIPSSFDCHRGNIPISNLTFVSEFCPVDPPNADVFDFGIYVDAIKFRTLGTKSFINKFSRSFWWGLQNLSSLGQNLETSSYVHENIFAVVISISGLLLFLYLIGNVQTYMTLATEKSEKRRQKMNAIREEMELCLSKITRLPKNGKNLVMLHLERDIKQGKEVDVHHIISRIEELTHDNKNPLVSVTELIIEKNQEKNAKERQAKSWMEKCNITDNEIKLRIMQYVELRLQEGRDVHLANILSILPSKLGFSVKKHLCLPILKKVQMLENMNEEVYETICSYLKPVVYQENSYIIREGEPLDVMLFIIEGVAWTFGSSINPMVLLRSGDYVGNELLEWHLSLKQYSEFPVAAYNVKCHTKLEAFTLPAIDLQRAHAILGSKIRGRDNEGSNNAKLVIRELRRPRHNSATTK